MAIYTGLKSDCQSLVPLMNKLDGYPVPGQHIGAGPHVPMPTTWNGSGKVPVGWTAHHEDAIFADQSLFSIPLSGNYQASGVIEDKLSAAEQLSLTTILARGTVAIMAILLFGCAAQPTRSASDEAKIETCLAKADTIKLLRGQTECIDKGFEWDLCPAKADIIEDHRAREEQCHP